MVILLLSPRKPKALHTFGTRRAPTSNCGIRCGPKTEEQDNNQPGHSGLVELRSVGASGGAPGSPDGAPGGPEAPRPGYGPSELGTPAAPSASPLGTLWVSLQEQPTLDFTFSGGHMVRSMSCESILVLTPAGGAKEPGEERC
ncbi:unnamed protein product [Arctogadus glacialis]